MPESNPTEALKEARIDRVEVNSSGVEKSFERRRGISNIVLKDGYAQVHISGFPAPVHPARLEILSLVRDAKYSIQLLKLTPSGLSFLVREESAVNLKRILEESGKHFTIKEGRSIVEIHAVNMRDEEGLIARVIASAIASGATMEHVGDMHDRLIITASNEDAKQIAEHILGQNIEATK